MKLKNLSFIYWTKKFLEQNFWKGYFFNEWTIFPLTENER